MKLSALYRELLDDDVMFFYKGDVSPQLITAISEVMDAGEAGRKTSGFKKYFNILVESLQNVIHHAESEQEEFEPFLLIRRQGDHLAITTGNAMAASRENSIREKIDAINAMDAGELREHYLHQLGEEGFSGKGGAGLGLINLARKSGKQLAYQFTGLDNDMSYLTLTVTL